MNGLRDLLEKVDADCSSVGTCELDKSESEAYILSGYIKRVSVGSVGGKVLCALTDDGQKLLEDARNAVVPTHFELMDNCSLLSKKRIHRIDKPSYPYEFMKIWQSFFVGCENDLEESAVRSSVNHANKKYEGCFFVSVKALRYERFGSFIAPCDGVLVMRVDKLD